MNFPKYKAGPVVYWLSAAATTFLNGFINGLGGGSFTGLGVGATTANTEIGANMSPLKQVLLAIATVAVAAVGSGFKEVIIWHKSNPFPNPYPAPADQPPTNKIV